MCALRPKTAVWKSLPRAARSSKSGRTGRTPVPGVLFAERARTSPIFKITPDRLKYPLKRVGDRFERISWDQALDEIAAKIKEIREKHGPRVHRFHGGRRSGLPFPVAFRLTLSSRAWGPRTTTVPWPRSTPAFFGWKERLSAVRTCIRAPMWTVRISLSAGGPTPW